MLVHYWDIEENELTAGDDGKGLPNGKTTEEKISDEQEARMVG